MNFNPMDLINLKEAFCPNTHPDFKAITKFISWLIDIQQNGLSDEMKKALGKNFELKQEMIQKAFDLTGMKFDFQKGG